MAGAELPAGAQNPASSLSESLIIGVHGSHRNCRYGYVSRWDERAQHRHVGSGNWPRGCGRDGDEDDDDDDDGGGGGGGGRPEACLEVGGITVCQESADD